MKTKNDFITNSSSTSYIFAFRGKDIEDFKIRMKQNWMCFEFKSSFDEDRLINVYDIIGYIEDENYEIFYIEDVIKNFENKIKEFRILIKTEMNETYNEWLEEKIDGNLKLIEDLKYIKSKGINTVIGTEFSDDDGNEIGNTIRSNRIKVNKNDLFIQPVDFD